jgi:hypothetical protein
MHAYSQGHGEFNADHGQLETMYRLYAPGGLVNNPNLFFYIGNVIGLESAL